MRRWLFLICLSATGFVAKAQRLNWSSFMDQQAMQWDAIGRNYYSGVLLGNGLLGVNIYQPEKEALRFAIGRSDVTDNRVALYPAASKLYTQARLPIGYFKLVTKGRILTATAKLDIYRAMAEGKLTTDSGEVQFMAYVSAVKDVITIDLQGRGKEQPQLEFVPEPSISPRFLQSYPKDKPAAFAPNPPIEKTTNNGFTIYHQALLNGGGYSTVYQTISDNQHAQTMISIGYDEDNSREETALAQQNLIGFQKSSANFAEHENWWRNYYPKSFVSVPDKRMETFYWAQLYKLAALTRPTKPMIDLMGPWTNPTPWPAIWWNLNTQLTYSPLFTSNHVELAEPLFEALNRYQNNLIENVPKAWQNDAAAIGRSSSYNLVSKISEAEIEKGSFESANLTWTLFYYYQYYLYTGDRATLKDKIYPLLKRSTNFLIHVLTKDEQGIYHLRESFSPEYKSAVDANYGLASLNWALNTLMTINSELGLKDKDAAKWKAIKTNLAPYPQNETGFMIGKDVALESSHRHYSHLMMIYPYHLVNWDDPKNHEVIEKSIQHWLSLKGALQGYTFTGAASMYASMGKGDLAYDMLNQLFDKYIRPNTLYEESGPVIETPLSALTSVQEMLLQSWGGKIRVFPAIPVAWKNAAFDQLLAVGAFEVSAKLENGNTTYIKIKSKIGGTCTLQTTLKPLVVKSDKGKAPSLKHTQLEGKQLLTFETEPGQIIEFFASKDTNKMIFPVAYEFYKDWQWGLNKGKTK